MPELPVSVVIPTRDRAEYLSVALASLGRQAAAPPHEIIVVSDGSLDATAEVAARAGAQLVAFESPRGLNAARNAGIGQSRGALVAFLDDDVEVGAGWIAAVVAGAARHPSSEAFGGPIRPRFEGPAPSSCGRDADPITALDLGPREREVEIVWGANFIVRREVFDRVGRFDESIGGHGDEEDWLLALRAGGGRITYLPEAWVEHRRSAVDSRLRPLALAAFRRGRGARVTDRRRGVAPLLRSELRVLAGCAWHTAYRRCPQGILMGAHAAGRLAAALDERRGRRARSGA